MAPPDDRESSSRKLCTDSFDNPFIAFQRFVDEQISSMLQSVTGLPSTLKNPRSWPRDPRPWPKDEANDTQLAESAEKRIPRGEDAVAHFLNESEYSPFNIENDPDLKVFGPLWLQAFGDLMDAAEGRRMASTTREFNKAEWVAHYVPRWAKAVEDRAAAYSPLHAVLREFSNSTDPFEQLQVLRRTIADNYWTNTSSTDNTDEEANEAQEETELEMYERMLAMGNNDSADSRSPTTSSAPSPSPEPPTSSPLEPTSSIISTLTTTERVTMPDGSVRTRRVLKKRFSDGREESNESEEVQQPRKSSLNERVEDAWSRQTPKNAEETRQEPEEKRKGGWFWS